MITIQDEMFAMIEAEIEQTKNEENERLIVDSEKAKKVARMLVDLSLDKREADSLSNDYIAQIRAICK